MGVPFNEPQLARKLRRALKGEVLFDPFSRGRYATDASFYQIFPIGVAAPRDARARERDMGSPFRQRP